jgi:UDPglucose--hexose-1-phosphate uridylyltransferase
MFNFDAPHRRLNPLTGEWVLVSPHRARRPWLGQVETVPPEDLPPYDATCYLCPGNSRAAGRVNPPYAGTFVFDNDFPALLRADEITYFDDEQASRKTTQIAPGPIHAPLFPPLFQGQAESGICRVVCFSPRHDLTLPELSQPAVEQIIRTWTDQSRELGEMGDIAYVQVFENKGAMMGCSNPHPHSQIWAASQVPVEPAKELVSQAEYSRRHGACLLCDYLAAEEHSGERLVCRNQHFTALVPFWAFWPFEILLVGKRHIASLGELLPEEVTALADILRRVTARYDNLFEVSFPYSMGFHQPPIGASHKDSWHLHAHFYPPLLRSATVRKFMVGYELLAMPQRDLTPEAAAKRLRGLSEIHYRQR